MANLPQLRSPEQIAGDIISGFTSRLPFVVDLNTGSVVAQLVEAVKQSNFKSYAAVIQMIDALSIDRAVGEALQRLAKDEGVPILSALPSSGYVSITDLTFQKISSTIYTGQPAPVQGSITLFVADASNWPASGVIYIGRGTTNYEGPLSYSSVAPQGNGSYWQVSLASTSPTTKFHNIGESVVVGQGGQRTINAGTVVQTAQGSSIQSVQFSTTSAAIILDGEVTVTQVPIICNTPGPVGNAPSGAIKTVLGLGFQAAADNPQPLSNGRNADTDDTLRARIKAFIASKAKGTPLAIQTAAQGVQTTDGLQQVVSAAVVSYPDNSAALVYDDGGDDEAVFTGVGLEQVVDQAVGGETDLTLRNYPVAQARIVCNLAGPYNIPNNYQLSCTVAGVATTHTFVSTDFQVSAAATPFEVASSINEDPNVNFLATTANGGTLLVVYPRDPDATDIQVNRLSSNDASVIIGLPDIQEFTLRLYRNNSPLYEQGLFATIFTRPSPSWSSSIADGDTLIYSVDKTPAITVTFTLADFQEVDLTASPSASTPIGTWAQVMTNLMPGIQATATDEIIGLTSTRGQSSKASVQLLGGTLLNKMFDVGVFQSSTGRPSDYTFNRETGQFGLNVPLQVGDQVSAGSLFTRANVVTAAIPAGPTQEGRAWFILDGSSQLIPSEIQSTTQIRFITNSGSRVVTLEARDGNSLAPQGFSQVLPGDWVLVWAESGDSANLISNQYMLRVQTAQVGQVTFEGDVQGSTTTTPWFNIPINRIALVRSAAPMQRLQWGVTDIVSFSQAVEVQVVGSTADIVGSTVRISTQSSGSFGQLLVVSVDSGGAALGLAGGTLNNNIPSHRAFTTTSDSEAGFPSFSFSQVTGFVDDHNFVDASFPAIGGLSFDMVEVLDGYDAPIFREIPDSDKARRVLVENFGLSPNTVKILTPSYMQSGASGIDSDFNAEHPTIQPGARYFLRSAYQFDSADTLSVIVDGQEQTGSYSVPVARRLAVSNHSTPTLQDFSAIDLESSLGLNDPNSFQGFDFNNFKVWRQAHATLTNGDGDGDYALLMQNGDFGPSGNYVRVGFLYPNSPTQTSLSALITQGDALSFGIVLPVSTVRTPNWDASSSFTVSVSTSGGVDAVTYQWRVGTQPNFSTAGVVPGDIAMLAYQLQFLPADSGYSARVQSVTPTSFTVQLPTGKVTSDALSWDTMVTTNRVITLTKAAGHSIQAGQQFGLYGTAILIGSTRPYDSGSYTALTATSTTVTAIAPNAVPSGSISAGTHLANVVTITAPNHGLYAGNIVKISSAGAPYDGIYSVSAVLDVNHFQYVLNGSSSPIASGTFDFQSIGASGLTATITTITRPAASNVVTVNTSAPHGFTVGQLVSIANVTISNWVAGTYNLGDVVRSPANTQVYKNILAGASATDPSLDPTHWSLTSFDLTGTFPVASTPTGSQFTYLYSDQTGQASGTGGTATEYTILANLARSIGGTASYLSFAQVSTTAQAVQDFLSTSVSGQIVGTVSNGAPTAVISMSTEDEGLAGGYLSGNITDIGITEGSRLIVATSDTDAPVGSTITMSVTDSQYDGSYVVLRSVQSGPSWLLTLVSSVLAASTGATGATGTFTGSTPYFMLQDGANSVLSTTLSAGAGSPMFTVKQAWVKAPAIGEELRLVALTSDQLSRFWNKLVVTGLSNVSEIDNSQYGRQLQIVTDTFGSAGSVQVAGGTANSKVVAMQGSGNSSTNRWGTFPIPYGLRAGINGGSWLTLQNTVRDNKELGFNQNTTVQLQANGIALISSENFVTQRATTQDTTTKFKVEAHGQFVAFITVSGTSLGLATAGVREGDWVRIKNTSPKVYSSGTAYVTGNKVRDSVGNFYVAVAPSTNQPLTNPTYWSPYNVFNLVTAYSAGAYVTYNGRLWFAAVGSTGVTPGTDDTTWAPREFDGANNGVFRVIRTFGQDAFWVQNANAVEELTQLGDPTDLSFYTYDSVMPGDTLVISGNILGSANVGRYTVQDETADGSVLFPAPKFVFTQPIPAPNGAVLLGLNYSQVNFEEGQPAFAVKRVVAVGPGTGGLANVLVESPELCDRFSSSNGAFVTVEGKLDFPTGVTFGLDGYKYYGGLIKQLNTILYGDPTNTVTYPGVRAAGTDVREIPALIKRIRVGLSIRVQIGVSPQEVISQVQAAVAGYVNQLDVGAPVVLGLVVTAAQSVNGVASAALTFPTYNSANDQIAVGADQRAKVVTPSSDVVVSILGS
jgi:alkylated DNA nucleotide flippase Atl1/uncharacterized glyoxalase superfamily protein PhnB